MIHIRRVLYNNTGYVKGQYLGVWNGTMQEAFEKFSSSWMEQHTNFDNELDESIPENDVDYIDEFTVTSHDHIFIGLPNIISYEIIDSELYIGYPGCKLDEYGFELMKDCEDNIVPYSSISSAKSD